MKRKENAKQNITKRNLTQEHLKTHWLEASAVTKDWGWDQWSYSKQLDPWNLLFLWSPLWSSLFLKGILSNE